MWCSVINLVIYYAKYKKKSGRKSNSKQHKDISSGITHNFPTTLHVNFIT